MTRFLGASWRDDSSLTIRITTDARSCLQERGGRVSPIHPLNPDSPIELPFSGAVAFLFPISPRATLAHILNDQPEAIADSTYVTHGLAAIVLIQSDRSVLQATIADLQLQLNAFEIWPFAEGVVEISQTNVWRAERTAGPPPPDLGYADLPAEIAIEVRQYNSNVVLLRSAALDFCPEFLELTAWLDESVPQLVLAIRRDLAVGEAARWAHSQLHHHVSLLVDINSCLTMVISQVAGVLPPLTSSNFPVGEYSLLGIGSMTRAAWRTYNHISTIFATADHVSRLRNGFGTIGFDPGFQPNDIDFETWGRARAASIDASQTAEDKPGRKHLVYFSSRWGFHETLNSISLSWQSLSAGATREWNLLTLSHEFLHSHFRELVRFNILGLTSDHELDLLVGEYNQAGGDRTPPPNFLLSCRFFLINQMKWALQAERAAPAIAKGNTKIKRESHVLTASWLKDLMATVVPDFIEEVVVHVMDYHYFYNLDDASYVSSLWNSWALVPFVHTRLNHYLVRTLLALSSQFDKIDAEQAFDSSVERLRTELERSSAGRPNALSARGLDALNDALTMGELWVRFKFSYELVIFTKTFLIDTRLYDQLTADEGRVPGPPPQYRISPGEFPTSPINSPTAFFFDRYALIDGHRDEMEYVSLWQMLVLL